MATPFGKRLKQLRKEAGKTAEDIARATGLSLSAVTRLEAGGSPNWDTALAIAKALGVSVSAFESGDDEEDKEQADEKPTKGKKPKGK